MMFVVFAHLLVYFSLKTFAITDEDMQQYIHILKSLQRNPTTTGKAGKSFSDLSNNQGRFYKFV